MCLIAFFSASQQLHQQFDPTFSHYVVINSAKDPSEALDGSPHKLLFHIKAAKEGLEISWLRAVSLVWSRSPRLEGETEQEHRLLTRVHDERYQFVKCVSFGLWGFHSSMINYFELTILSMGVRRASWRTTAEVGAIGIGSFWRSEGNGESYDIKKMPGWLPGSIGYHGDDGAIYFENDDEGSTCTDGWEKGDVIGHGAYVTPDGLNYFFTLNGKEIRTVSVKGELSQFVGGPLVGMQYALESCTVNLGDTPFKFDLSSKYQQHIKTQSSYQRC